MGKSKWSFDEAMIAEREFDKNFDQIYEEKFLDFIFEGYSSQISRYNFIEAIKPKDLDDLFNFECGSDTALYGTATWLFKPSKLREIYNLSIKNNAEHLN